jgi:transposase
MHYLSPQDRHQLSIISPSLDEMIPPEADVRLLDLLVGQVVGSNPDKFRYKGQVAVGRKAYSPQTMLKLYLYGYLNGISSSRKLERECGRNIEVMWLLGNLRPDFKTIADYRKDMGDHIRYLTHQFRLFLRDHGYIKGQLVAIDGTKLKANARRGMLKRSVVEQRLEQASEQMDAYLSQLTANDRRDELLEEVSGAGNDTGELVDKIIALEAEISRLKEHQRQMDSKGENYHSPTDPDARLMKSLDGKLSAYNVQTAVDSKHRLVVSAEVTTEGDDHNQLTGNLERVEQTLGSAPVDVVADKGYYVLDEIEKLEESKETRVHVPVQQGQHDREKVSFRYDPDQDEYICSQGKRLVLIARNKRKKNSYADVYRGIECGGCPIRSSCTRSKQKGRIVHRYHNQAWRDQYKQRMQSTESQEYVHRRKAIVEHPFGTLKIWMGKIPLLLRGRSKVQSEVDLYVSAYNLRRMMNIVCFTDLEEMIRSYDWEIA